MSHFLTITYVLKHFANIVYSHLLPRGIIPAYRSNFNVTLHSKLEIGEGRSLVYAHQTYNQKQKCVSKINKLYFHFWVYQTCNHQGQGNKYERLITMQKYHPN